MPTHVDKIFFILVFTLLLPHSAVSQLYPKWFLFQGDVQCSNITVGYVRPSYNRDSSIAQSFRNSCDVYAKNTKVHIAGGQAFWATEGGTVWMGSNYVEEFDSTLSAQVQKKFAVLDSYISKGIAIVLAGDSSCVRKIDDERIRIASVKKPEWTEAPPQDARNYYSVGVAEEYFYESSSWTAAENNARMSLARQLFVSLKTLQKSDMKEGQDIRDEELSVTLANVHIAARWRDIQKKIYYVLMRMPK